MLIFPLSPSSASVILGMIVNTRNMTITKAAESKKFSFTSNTSNNKTYCNTIKTYLTAEKNKTFVKNCHRNYSIFSTTKRYFATKGIFSSNRMSHDNRKNNKTNMDNPTVSILINPFIQNNDNPST